MCPFRALWTFDFFCHHPDIITPPSHIHQIGPCPCWGAACALFSAGHRAGTPDPSHPVHPAQCRLQDVHVSVAVVVLILLGVGFLRRVYFFHVLFSVLSYASFESFISKDSWCLLFSNELHSFQVGAWPLCSCPLLYRFVLLSEIVCFFNFTSLVLLVSHSI